MMAVPDPIRLGMKLDPPRLVRLVRWGAVIVAFAALGLIVAADNFPSIDTEASTSIFFSAAILSVLLQGAHDFFFAEQALEEELKQHRPTTRMFLGQLYVNGPPYPSWFYKPLVRRLWGAFILIVFGSVATYMFV